MYHVIAIWTNFHQLQTSTLPRSAATVEYYNAIYVMHSRAVLRLINKYAAGLETARFLGNTTECSANTPGCRTCGRQE